jgi:hypothetical protein
MGRAGIKTRDNNPRALVAVAALAVAAAVAAAIELRATGSSCFL